MRKRIRRASTLLAAVAGMAASMAVATAPGGAATATTTVAFPAVGAPTGGSCAATYLQSAIPLVGTDDNIPFTSYDGIPLGLLVESPPPLTKLSNPIGENCGDTTHGSSAFGPLSSAKTAFADGNGVLGLTSTATVTANPIFNPTGIFQMSITSGQQSVSTSLMPVLGPASRSITITVNYDVLAAPTPNVSYVAPILQLAGTECSGGPGPTVTISGDGSQTVGTHAFSMSWSCPTGETITGSLATAGLTEYTTAREGPSVGTATVAESAEYEGAQLSVGS